jgi:hypothetical protein
MGSERVVQSAVRTINKQINSNVADWDFLNFKRIFKKREGKLKKQTMRFAPLSFFLFQLFNGN